MNSWNSIWLQFWADGILIIKIKKHQHLITNLAAVLGSTERKSPNNAKPFSLGVIL
jgi:hypothetical protein